MAHAFSSEDPEALRGPQFAAAWSDEWGSPAVDKGATSPTFSRPEIVGECDPLLSTGVRDDLVQRRFCEAMLAYWDTDHPDHVAGSNPVSGVSGGRMVRQSRTHLLDLDARPFPAFPYLLDVWGDAENWRPGTG